MGWSPSHVRFFTGRERGETSLIFVSMLSLISVIGIGYLIDRSLQDRRISKLSVRMDQGFQLPVSAAVVAKALISAPDPSLAAWNTNALVANSKLLPSIYPRPYISSQDVIDGHAIQGGLAILNGSPAGASWDFIDFQSKGLINIATMDANRFPDQQLDAVLLAASSKNEQITKALQLPTTKSTVRYALKNCTANGASASTWTGHYCAEATITSDNFMTGKERAGSRESKVFLGNFPPPPEPICHLDSSPLTIDRGQTVSIAVEATGVVTGYTFDARAKVSGADVVYASEEKSRIFTNANDITGRNSFRTFNFNTSVLNKTQLPDGTSVVISIVLKGITGNTQCAQKIITVRSSPKCDVVLHDINPYANPQLGAITTRPHENSFVFAKLTVRDIAAGDEVRMQFANMTVLDGNFKADAKGLVMPTSNGSQFVKATAQGAPNSGAFGAVGRIWRGGSVVAQCDISGKVAGQWFDSNGTNCRVLCTSKGLLERFDKNGMSCLSGENFYNPSYGAKKNGTNNPSFGSVGQLKTAVKFQTWGDGTGDFEYLSSKYPGLNKKTMSEGKWCYWLNGTINSYAGCTGDLNPLSANGCQKFDNDDGSSSKATDVVRACYCGAP